MAEDKNGLVFQIKEIVKNELKFSDRYGIQYLEQESFCKIERLLSKMRREKLVNGDEYHTLFHSYKHLYQNRIKYKDLISKEPRYAAQLFIGRKDIRKLIFERDKACLCCGSTEFLSLDHIVPINKGGPNEIENLQTLCRSCNSRKSDKIIDYRIQK